MMKIDDLLTALWGIVALHEEGEASFHDVAEAVAKAFGAKACWIHALDPTGAALLLRAASGTLEAPISVPMDPALGKVMEHGKASTPPAGRAGGSLFPGFKGAVLSVPLQGGDGTVGLLTLVGTRKRAFSSREDQALRIVGRCLARAMDPSPLYMARFCAPDEFRQALRRERKRAGRYSRHVSLLLLHLENMEAFCRANAEPDPALVYRGIAELVRVNLREADLMAPHGRRGYLILLPETSSPHASQTANKLRKLLQEYPVLRTRHVTLRVRIGVATFPNDAATSASLLRVVESAVRG